MQVYIVGGAVRDQLLNRAYTDKDFVVVGATPEQMLQAGFIQVGEDFPVFLHPETKEEYALARTERKSGKGYKGFEVYASPEVTIEEDLLRRDLTINAMAIEVTSLMDDTPVSGDIVDPYNGQQDIEDKVLRHVSEAFSEDPLRVLRIARFYGRFFDDDLQHSFSIAEDTLALIKVINESDELKHLTAERVWQETSRALLQTSAQAYYDCLIKIGSLPHIMPNLAQALADPSIKTLVFKALQLAGIRQLNLAQRWAILNFAFATDCAFYLNSAKDANPTISKPINSESIKSELTNSKPIDSEAYQRWSNQSTRLAQALKVPKKIAQFNQAYINSHAYLTCLGEPNAEQITKLIALTKADKDHSELDELLEVHKIIELAYQQLQFERYIEAYKKISIKDVDAGLQGSAIGEAIQQARNEAIAKLL